MYQLSQLYDNTEKQQQQGGSRLSEFRKIPIEIFRKSTTFSVTFCKKYKNQ